MVYLKIGVRVDVLHDIAAGRKIPTDNEIVQDYLYSINMIIDGNPALGEFIINDYLVEQTPTYSSSAGVTGPSSIIIMNLDDFVNRALEVIETLDGFIDEKLGVHGNDPTDDTSAEHH
ncbi:unnamed protein product [Rotaria sp. Silwood2]|nr:unnamed protein product [Rotaria sp. Silwood2]CAF2921023.1 unnamed protein product [Rotaria sp. Silwood2]CAF4067917.1 unnamed protein product [Rotaria sp. Silwood2]CAF4101153.1 unnamed protein product [Rotaria sp. Silwood2]